MQAERGAAQVRVECFFLRVTPKYDKQRGKYLDLRFSIKLDAEMALVCDSRIQRAFEDCEDLAREIERVQLKSEIGNTNIDFFDLPTSAKPIFKLENVSVVALMCERNEGHTYLYFAIEARLDVTGLGPFALGRYHSALFCEFTASQHALDWDAAPSASSVDLAPEQSSKLQEIARDFVASLPADGTTVTLSTGDVSATITPEMVKQAKAAKKARRGDAV